MQKVLIVLSVLLLASCVSPSKESLKKVISENPDIITDAIESNPEAFIEALNKAVQSAQMGEAKKREEEEKMKMEEAFKNPLKPNIRQSDIFRGNKDGPIVLVEYSDFECPYCQKAYNTVNDLMEKYDGKIKFVYKHLPLSFHPKGELAALYFEAIKLQSPDKAWKFHDEVYENQRKLQSGEGFLKEISKKLGVDMGKLAKDVKSEKVQTIVDEDTKEANSFGFQGTPGFVLNGIPVKGAYPLEHFQGIIEQLKERGDLVL